MRYPNRWLIGQWAFYEVQGVAGPTDETLYYGYAQADGERRNMEDKIGELYLSLEHAMAAAIAEKFTGARGAGGTGVGTAADWFMRMIGAYEVTPVDRPDQKLTEALAATDSYRGPLFGRSHRMADWLADRGLTIAKVRNGG